jgi:dolichyl-phosphate-mannose-protein mannosyltransferase
VADIIARDPDTDLRHGLPSEAPPWLRIDSVITAALLIAAASTRFFRLATPPTVVFDEQFTLGVAHNLLEHQPFRDTHPPFAGEVVALSMKLLGDNSLSWRLANASLGTAIVAITYLLGRRMFNSRLAGAMAAGFILCDGLFLVDSRLALWEIFYLTFASIAYLMLFRFAQSVDPFSRRRSLVGMGLALGLALGSKLGIPVVTSMLTLGATMFVVAVSPRTGDSVVNDRRAIPYREMLSIMALVGGLSALVYLAVFMPIYWFGWWHGIGDQIVYYQAEYRNQTQAFHGNPHHYSSPWWSWPLMLRPIRYYMPQEFIVSATGAFPSIRGIGNPILWWGALMSMVLIARQSVTRKNVVLAFLVAGYLLYLAMWIPIRRFQFIYYYMPALYLGFLALAAMLAECWEGATRKWEEGALLIAASPALILGLGTLIGAIAIAAVAIAYAALLRIREKNTGPMVCVLYLGGALVLFVYFLPLLIGLPLTPEQFNARMWLRGPGLPNWR